jgi:hypothetical protein
VGPRNGLDGLEKRRNLLLLPGFEPGTVQPRSVLAIVTTLEAQCAFKLRVDDGMLRQQVCC